MDIVVIIGLVLAVLVGISLGLMGGGGSILTVPILTYVLGMTPQEAIAASLFIVGTTSAVSALGHHRAGRVRWRVGLVFGLAGMGGAFAGGILGGYLPGTLLMVLFALMMVATSIAMIRPRAARNSAQEGAGRELVGAGSVASAGNAGVAGAQATDAALSEEAGAALSFPESVGADSEPVATGNAAGASSAADDGADRPWLRIVIDGLLVGLATGLVGAGGGFLVVPALTLLGGLPMAVAVGTSLLVIALKSYAGLAGYLFAVQVQWPLVLTFTAIAIIGSLIGTRWAGRIPERALRRGFGIFVLVMGVFVLAQEVPRLIAGLGG